MIHFGSMKIDSRSEGAVAILAPDGRITIGEASEVWKRALASAIDGGATHVIVDGSRIAYMDSSGIGEMIAALRRLIESGGKMGIAAPTPKLREILEITGLNTIFVVGESEGAVLNQLPVFTR